MSMSPPADRSWTPTDTSSAPVRSESLAFSPFWNVRTSADVHAEAAGQGAEAADIALADGPELPLAAVAVHLAEDHRRLGAGVLGQVVAHDLGTGVLVDDTDEGVVDLAEVL